MKAKIILSTFLFALTIAVALFAFSLFFDFSKGPYSAKTVFIPKNSSLNQVAMILQDEGVIRSLFRFKILVSIMGKSQKIKPGEYEFSVPMDPIDILHKIVAGRVKTYKFTVPEGVTAAYIAKELEAAGLGNSVQFLSFISDPEIMSKYGIKGPTVEGYLFPETYILDKTMSEKQILIAMIERLFKTVPPELITQASQKGLSLHSVVTIASIIEKETGLDEERPLVSSVIHNRLKLNMRLQCDPTVIYGISGFSGNLTKKDLSTKTPYNTYVIRGLPLGPISNPGLSSIKAAVYPARTDYLYFVAKKDGSHFFSKTYGEHVRMVGKYQLKGRKNTERK